MLTVSLFQLVMESSCQLRMFGQEVREGQKAEKLVQRTRGGGSDVMRRRGETGRK